MAAEFRLPDVGEGLHEAELVEWTVSVGDEVREGDVVVVVNTEKVTVELPSPVEGRVVELIGSPGDVVRVGDVLVRFDTTDQPATPTSTQMRVPVPAPASPVAAPASGGLAEASPNGACGVGVVVAAPSTRRLAADHGIDLRVVAGSGPGGRILRHDVLAAVEGSRGDVGDVESAGGISALTGVRGASARNLRRSRDVTITCTTTFEVRGDGLVALLDSLDSSEPKVTLPAIVAVCAADVLQRHPHLNGYLTDDGDTLALQDGVHVAFAVATDAGLTVPVLRDVHRRRLREVAAELRDLSDRARRGELRAEELRGGTFTVSSTGGLERDGVLSTTPVINYPQITTLWVGRLQQAPRVAADGTLEAGPVLRASLSFDHRFVDGIDATRFIADLTDALERPLGAIA